jgi:tRNA modification GTPase
MDDSIVALASARGSAALAVIRASGPRCFDIVGSLCKNREKLLRAKAGSIGVHTLHARDGAMLDEVCIAVYHAPKSFTGEDMAEIFCHGNEMIVELILGELERNGARHAREGEFSKRAFRNGKISLTEAEGIAALIGSSSQAGREAALNAYCGGQRKKLFHWRDRIENIVMQLESIIEFGEEHDDVSEKADTESMKEEMRAIAGEIESELQRREDVRLEEEGIIAAIMGPPNAGKSSVLNAIMGYDRAIVHPHKGATRDCLHETITMNKRKIRIIDTAGLCTGDSDIEAIGIQKAWECFENAHIIIWITAANEKMHEEERAMIARRGTRTLVGFINKCDIERNEQKEELMRRHQIPWSSGSIRYEGSNKVRKLIEAAVGRIGQAAQAAPIIANERQERILRAVKQDLQMASDLGWGSEEIASEQCRSALRCLGEFTGESCPEELINSIFDQFCIGK